MTATLTAPTAKQPMTEDTAFLLTNAGLDALLNAPVVPDEDDAPNSGEVAGEVTEEQAEAADAFTPDTKQKADWVIGKIADARARAARIREHGEMMARDAEREAEHLEWKYGAALQALCRKETEGERRKSLPLYHGVIGFKTSPQRVKIAAGMETQAVAWARTHKPEAVTERVDVAALKGGFEVSEAGQAVDPSTGEALEWVSVTAAEEVFYIR